MQNKVLILDWRFKLMLTYHVQVTAAITHVTAFAVSSWICSTLSLLHPLPQDQGCRGTGRYKRGAYSSSVLSASFLASEVASVQHQITARGVLGAVREAGYRGNGRGTARMQNVHILNKSGWVTLVSHGCSCEKSCDTFSSSQRVRTLFYDS